MNPISIDIHARFFIDGSPYSPFHNQSIELDSFYSRLFCQPEKETLNSIIRIGMMAVTEFHNMESTAVHIEMDIPFLEIRCGCFLNHYFGVQFFHCTPGSIYVSLIKA